MTPATGAFELDDAVWMACDSCPPDGVQPLIKLRPLLGLPLDQASSEAAGLHELIRHHPALRRETAALSSLVEAAELLSQFNWTTAKRFNS